MPSVSSKTFRRPPQQSRSERTLASILEAAAQIILERGSEALTMTDLATRADLSVGGLYHYFPDKQAIMVALISQYAADLQQKWQPMLERAKSFTAKDFADYYLASMVEFLRERPAFLVLIGNSVRFRGTPEARRSLRVAVATSFQRARPELSEHDAFLAANVTIQLLRGLMHLLRESPESDHDTVLATYRDLLLHYCTKVLG